MKLATHCPNCFQPGTAKLCPHCQYDRAALFEPLPAQILPPFTQVGDYTLGRMIGDGGFASVYTAYRRTDRLCG